MNELSIVINLFVIDGWIESFHVDVDFGDPELLVGPVGFFFPDGRRFESLPSFFDAKLASHVQPQVLERVLQEVTFFNLEIYFIKTVKFLFSF